MGMVAAERVFNILETIDIENIKNKYKKITANFINLIKLLFDELSLL